MILSPLQKKTHQKTRVWVRNREKFVIDRFVMRERELYYIQNNRFSWLFRWDLVEWFVIQKNFVIDRFHCFSYYYIKNSFIMFINK